MKKMQKLEKRIARGKEERVNNSPPPDAESQDFAGKEINCDLLILSYIIIDMQPELTIRVSSMHSNTIVGVQFIGDCYLT